MWGASLSNELPDDPFRRDDLDPALRDDPTLAWIDEAKMLTVAFADSGSLANLRRRLATADRADVENAAAFETTSGIRDAVYESAAEAGLSKAAIDARWLRWLLGPADATSLDDLGDPDDDRG